MNHMAEETPQPPPVTIVAASRDASNRPMRYQHNRRRSRADFDNDVPPSRPPSSPMERTRVRTRCSVAAARRTASAGARRGRDANNTISMRAAQRHRANLVVPAHSSRPQVVRRPDSRCIRGSTRKAIMTELSLGQFPRQVISPRSAGIFNFNLELRHPSERHTCTNSSRTVQ